MGRREAKQSKDGPLLERVHPGGVLQNEVSGAIPAEQREEPAHDSNRVYMDAPVSADAADPTQTIRRSEVLTRVARHH